MSPSHLCSPVLPTFGSPQERRSSTKVGTATNVRRPAFGSSILWWGGLGRTQLRNRKTPRRARKELIVGSLTGPDPNLGFVSAGAALGRPHDPSRIGSNAREMVVWGQKKANARAAMVAPVRALVLQDNNVPVYHSHP